MQHVTDKGRSVVFDNNTTNIHNTAHAEYVDNFAAASTNPKSATALVSNTTQFLESHGVACHEVEPANAQTTFTGLDFDGLAGSIRISIVRLWKLRRALQ